MAKKIVTDIMMDGYMDGYIGQPRVACKHYTLKQKEVWFEHYDIGKIARKKEQMLELLVTEGECNE